MKAGAGYFMAQPQNAPNSKPSDCGWTRGTFYTGLTSYHNVSGDAAALSFASTWASLHNWTCGGLWQFVSSAEVTQCTPQNHL